MHEVVNDGRGPSKRPFVFYAILAMLVVLLLNALLFPSMLKRSVIEVGYDQFLEMIDGGEVTEVAYDEYNGEFVFIAKKDGAEQIYKTGIWPDDGQRLLQQLREHEDITFSAAIPTQANPLISFILTWVLPILFFFIIGEVFYRWMRKKMNDQIPGGMGNALSFGKSGAKIYVADAKTGVTFDNVAGQDEAKDSLVEVVDYLHDPKKYAAIGAKLPKGVLLVGPPSPFRAASVWKCSSAWARPKCATCLSRPMRKPPASCSLTRSTPSARSATPAAWAATTRGSRPSTSFWPKWTASTGRKASCCWPPPTGPRASIPPCCVPAGLTAGCRWSFPTSRAARLSCWYTPRM